MNETWQFEQNKKKTIDKKVTQYQIWIIFKAVGAFQLQLLLSRISSNHVLMCRLLRPTINCSLNGPETTSSEFLKADESTDSSG